MRAHYIRGKRGCLSGCFRCRTRGQALKVVACTYVYVCTHLETSGGISARVYTERSSSSTCSLSPSHMPALTYSSRGTSFRSAISRFHSVSSVHPEETTSVIVWFRGKLTYYIASCFTRSLQIAKPEHHQCEEASTSRVPMPTRSALVVRNQITL
jgi:hypothetical protein